MMRSTIVFGLIAIIGSVVFLRCDGNRYDDAAHSMAVKLKQSQESLQVAKVRESYLRDSVEQLDQERDSQWTIYVRDLRSKSQAEIQVAAHAAARRARLEVEARIGSIAPDTAIDRSPCTLTFLCTEVIAWQASDSLHRVTIDSSASAANVQAAACSTKVAEVRVDRDSTSVAIVSSIVPQEPWWRTARTLLVVALLSGAAGYTAAASK